MCVRYFEVRSVGPIFFGASLHVSLYARRFSRDHTGGRGCRSFLPASPSFCACLQFFYAKMAEQPLPSLFGVYRFEWRILFFSHPSQIRSRSFDARRFRGYTVATVLDIFVCSSMAIFNSEEGSFSPIAVFLHQSCLPLPTTEKRKTSCRVSSPTACIIS